VHLIVGVIAGQMHNQVSVCGLGHLAVGKVLADSGRDRRSGAGGPALLAYDHPFPFGQQRLCPQHFVHTVLSQGEHHVHDREREQHVGVDEDPRH
jgi:hypothetical protein